VAVGKVLARGQVTVPREIREALGIHPGDALSFRVTGTGKLEVSLLPRLRLEDALRRYRITGAVDDADDRAAWQATAAEDAGGPARG